MRAHVRCGLGFVGSRLCKAETEGKKLAEGVPFEEAVASVEEAGGDTVFLQIFLLAFFFC